VQYAIAYSDGSRLLSFSWRSNATGSGWGSWSGIMLGGFSFQLQMPTGYNAKVSLNDAVAPDRSLGASSTNLAIATLIAAGKAVDPGAPIHLYTANDLRAATVALIDWGAAGGSCRINGFAKLWIESVPAGRAAINGYWI